MADLVGAITANVYMLLIISIFAARLLKLPEVGRWLGLASSLVLFPLIYLFVSGLMTEKPVIYFAWLTLLFLFVLFELVVDGILKVDFRNVRWALVLYVMAFFAATGGMIGVASQAGKPWTITTSIVFLVMAALAFIQRRITGL